VKRPNLLVLVAYRWWTGLKLAITHALIRLWEREDD
jgi:hypothetical protein